MVSQYHDKFEIIRKIGEFKRAFAVIDSPDNPSQSFLITSGANGEGKTTIALGFALAAAENNKKVLAVDFNWYSPSLHQYFDAELIEPDSDLGGKQLLADSIVPSGKKNIDILPAVVETNGWSGSLSSKKDMVQEFLNDMKEKYQVIIVDASSVFPINHKMIDPLILGSNLDGVVMVTLTNVNPRQALKKACTAFEAGGANLVGIVANNWRNPISA